MQVTFSPSMSNNRNKSHMNKTNSVHFGAMYSDITSAEAFFKSHVSRETLVTHIPRNSTNAIFMKKVQAEALARKEKSTADMIQWVWGELLAKVN